MKTIPIFPDEFRARMEKLLGEKSWKEFSDAYQIPLKRSLRANTNLVSREDFLAMAKRNGWDLSPIPWVDNGFFIDREDHSVALGKTMQHFLGLFYIQEASSMAPARALDPQPGETVLDMSSAPGSKTTQMSCLMGNTGLIVANDVSTQRTKATVTNIERQACSNVGITTLDAKMFARLTPNTYDRVLLDAPCSGEGTFTKADAFFQRWNGYAIRRMAGIQRGLIEAAFQTLKPGGTLVYSTCTFAPEENEEVLDFLLTTFPTNARIEELDGSFGTTEGVTVWEGKTYHPDVARGRRFLPHVTGTGGFFVAKISKAERTASDAPPKENGRSKEILVGKKEEAAIREFLVDSYGTEEEAFGGRVFTRIDDDLWIKPAAYVPLSQNLRFDRCGVQILTVEHGNRYRLTTAGARAFGKYFTRNILPLDEEACKRVAEGRDVRIDDEMEAGLSVPHAVLTTEDGYVLGVGLVRDGNVKNQIPRALL